MIMDKDTLVSISGCAVLRYLLLEQRFMAFGAEGCTNNSTLASRVRWSVVVKTRYIGFARHLRIVCRGKLDGAHTGMPRIR